MNSAEVTSWFFGRVDCARLVGRTSPHVHRSTKCTKFAQLAQNAQNVHKVHKMRTMCAQCTKSQTNMAPQVHVCVYTTGIGIMHA